MGCAFLVCTSADCDPSGTCTVHRETLVVDIFAHLLRFLPPERASALRLVPCLGISLEMLHGWYFSCDVNKNYAGDQ